MKFFLLIAIVFTGLYTNANIADLKEKINEQTKRDAPVCRALPR